MTVTELRRIPNQPDPHDPDNRHLPPHDLHAEKAHLGALLISPDAAERHAHTIAPADYYSTTHQHIAHAIADLHAAGHGIDAITLAHHLEQHELLHTIGGRNALTDIQAAAGRTRNLDDYITAITDTATRRRLIATAHTIAATAHNHPADRALDEATRHLDNLTNGHHTRHHGPAPQTATDFLNADEPEYDWLIPGVLEPADRLIITGGEGSGKTTLTQQIAYQTSLGIHPFGGTPHTPRRVLLIDLENPTRILRRRITDFADRQPPTDTLHIISRPAGIDLHGDPTDRQWLEQTIRTTQPELLVIGPIYKLWTGDPTEELPAKTVTEYLDHLRNNYGPALILEAHTPHSAPGKHKIKRPYGASIWTRWPEFGRWLSPRRAGTATLDEFRGDRDTRDIPRTLTDSGNWPWSTASGRDATFASMLAAVHEGAPTSVRGLADYLDVPKSTVQRAIDNNRRQWEDTLADLDTP